MTDHGLAFEVVRKSWNAVDDELFGKLPMPGSLRPMVQAQNVLESVWDGIRELIALVVLAELKELEAR